MVFKRRDGPGVGLGFPVTRRSVNAALYRVSWSVLFKRTPDFHYFFCKERGQRSGSYIFHHRKALHCAALFFFFTPRNCPLGGVHT